MNITPPIMTTKFYHTENASRPFKKSGFAFTFIGYSNLGGNWQGVYSTDKPDEQSVLNHAALDPRTAITVITEDEFNALLKKKPVARGFSHVLDPRRPPLESPVPPRVAPVVIEPIISKPVAPKTPMISAAIELGEVAPMNPAPRKRGVRMRKAKDR